MPRATPIADDIGAENGRNACAATPAHSACAAGRVKRAFSSAAGSPEYSPKRAISKRVVRHAQHRAHEVGGDVAEARGERAEQRPPRLAVVAQAGGRPLDRAVGRGSRAAVERVRVLDLRPAPRQPVLLEVEPPRERRVECQRVCRRALVMDEARQRQLAAACPSAEAVGRLEHGHVDALGRQGQRGGEPVGPAADDHRGAHAVTSAFSAACGVWLTRSYPGLRYVTAVGIGPFGSHGCSLTASLTAQLPRSTTPTAASMTR